MKDLVDGGYEMHVALFPEGDISPKIDAEDAKFSNWHIEVGLDGLVKEKVTFKALAVTIT